MERVNDCVVDRKRGSEVFRTMSREEQIKFTSWIDGCALWVERKMENECDSRGRR
jgi:hypothetical protein